MTVMQTIAQEVPVLTVKIEPLLRTRSLDNAIASHEYRGRCKGTLRGNLVRDSATQQGTAKERFHLSAQLIHTGANATSGRQHPYSAIRRRSPAPRAEGQADEGYAEIRDVGK
jgi:hypothetical protein